MSNVETGALQGFFGIYLYLSLMSCVLAVEYIFVPEGQSVTFNFLTAGPSSVTWFHNDIHGSGKWTAIERDSRFEASTNAGRTLHVLTVNDVQLRDAGYYGFSDDGTDIYQELIVLENQLKCTSNVDDKHSDDEKLKPDKNHRDLVKMRCTIIYCGSKPPTLQWSLVKNDSILNGLSLQQHAKTSVIASGRYSLFTSEITLSATKLLDHGSAKCQLAQPDNVWLDGPAVSSILWISDNLVIKCTGLVGSSYNKSLYISDAGRSCIHRVDLTRKTVEGWDMRVNHEPLDISITDDHTLLITVKILGADRMYGVVEYTSDGKFLREIRFDKSIKDAFKTVQISNNKFVVAHGFIETSLHRVCLVNTEGKIEKAFGGIPVVENNQLNFPVSLEVDKIGQQIFVADLRNSRIVVLDFNLFYQGLVTTQLNFEHPLSLFFDSETKRLLVGENSGRLLVMVP